MAAVCFGIGDSVLNTQIYALLGKLYSGQVMVRSFTVFQLYQNLGTSLGRQLICAQRKHGKEAAQRHLTLFSTAHASLASAVGYYYGLALPMHGAKSSLGQVWVQTALLIAGTVSFAWIDRKADRQRRQKAATQEHDNAVNARGERYSVNPKEASVYGK